MRATDPVCTIEPEVPATITLYVPGVVPGVLVDPPAKLAWLPHAMVPARTMSSASIPSRLDKRRLRAGIPKSRTQARATPPVAGPNKFNGRLKAIDAVVFTVNVAICAAVPLIVTAAGR